MNSRIQELAEQAGFGPAWFEEAKPGYPALPREGIVKTFAELIIKESAKIADIADENKCEWIGGNILTHFGIKK